MGSECTVYVIPRDTYLVAVLGKEAVLGTGSDSFKMARGMAQDAHPMFEVM